MNTTTFSDIGPDCFSGWQSCYGRYQWKCSPENSWRIVRSRRLWNFCGRNLVLLCLLLMTSIPQWTLMTKMFTKATKLKPPEPRNEFETNRRLPCVIPEVVGRWKAREQENKWHQSSHTTFLLHVRHLDRAIKFSRSIAVSQLIKEHQCYKLTGVSCVLSDLQLLQFSVNRFWPGVQVI